MSGEYSIDTEEHRTSETVKEILEKFGVDEKAAIEMIAFFNTFMLARQQKWRANLVKTYRVKAEEMYGLVKILRAERGVNISELRSAAKIGAGAPPCRSEETEPSGSERSEEAGASAPCSALKNVYEKSETVEKLEKMILEMITRCGGDLDV